MHGRWQKSSRSSGDGQCVEVRASPNGVDVRDSKNPDGPVLTFEQAVWQAFVLGLRRNSWDGS